MKSFAYGSLGALGALMALFVVLRPTEWVAYLLATVPIATVAGLIAVMCPGHRACKLLLVGGAAGTIIAAMIGLLLLYLGPVPR